MPEIIDLKDKKIITELSLNARAPISIIAKTVGLSKQVTKYRIDNLEKQGIIEGYYTILNINKLGLIYHRIFIKYRNVTKEIEEELVQYGIKHPKICWIGNADGYIDFIFLVLAKDGDEFTKVYEEIISKYGQYFDEKEISVTTRIHHYKYNFLLEGKSDDEIIMGGPLEQPHLDRIDWKILDLLSENARMSLLEIGQKVNLNPNAVKYRMTNLIRNNIILGFKTKINHIKLEYTQYKINLFLTKASKQDIDKLSEYIKSLPASIYITRAIGSSDLEFEVMVKSNKEFHDLMRELRFTFSEIIKGYSQFIIYYEPYISYLPD